MKIENTLKFGSHDLNAVLRIARLVMEMASTVDFYDLEIDGLNGFVVVKKWRRTPTKEGDELDIIETLMWKPGVRRTEKGYFALKDIERWLESEKAVHTEADLSLGEEREG